MSDWVGRDESLPREVSLRRLTANDRETYTDSLEQGARVKDNAYRSTAGSRETIIASAVESNGIEEALTEFSWPAWKRESID